MDKLARCELCGTTLIAGRCIACDTRRWSQIVHRELVLLTLLVALAMATFLITRSAAAADEALRREQASAWFATGRRVPPGGARIDALRRAVTKDPRNRGYRRALAEALIAGDLDDEARRTLMALWEAQPDDAETNLMLARLEARGLHPETARRYYQSALASLWRSDQDETRRNVRIEFIDYLLSHHDRGRALSELLALSPNVPSDPELLSRAGRLFLRAGDSSRALTEFETALALNPVSEEARTGAGEAAFDSGDYRRAFRYLDGAAGDARLADLRTVAQLVISADPLGPRLAPIERRGRMIRALEQSRRRLEACIALAPPRAMMPLEALRDDAEMFASTIASSDGRDASDDSEMGLRLVSRMQRAVDEVCMAAASPRDRALVLIARTHGADEP